jgi:pimeloyl-ACP methyl ester carboxylesterase
MTDAKHLLPGLEERVADVRGTPLRYYVGGSGPPLVLIHGLGGAASNFADLAPALARSRSVLVPELPGHGGSAPLPATASLAPYADVVGELMRREAAVPALVVGHSLGGVVALRLALRRPDDVSGLVLAAPAGIASTTRRARYTLRILGYLQLDRLAAPFRGWIAASGPLRWTSFARWGAADPFALSPRAALGFLEGPELHTDTRSAAAALVLDDPRADLDRVRCPCLVLWGADDRQLPVRDAFEYTRRLRAPLRVIPDCGHLLVGERADACLDAIESFGRDIAA